MGSSCAGKVDGGGLRTSGSMEKRLLKAMDVCEPYTAGDLAEEIDEPRRTVAYNLGNLAEEGKIHKKKHSSQNVTWWRTD